MGNSTSSFLPAYSCNDANLSRNTITPEYWNTHSISEDYKAASISTGVVMLIVFILGFLGNALIIIGIVYRHLFKEPTYILLLNLAISDFLLCLLVMPFTIISALSGGYIFGNSDYVRCRVCQTGIIFTVLTTVSLDVLALISLDRFIFIKFPLRYSKIVTVKRLMVVISLVWLKSIAESILPLFGFGEVKFTYSLSTCTLYLYGKTHLTRNIYYVILLAALGLIPISIIIITNIWILLIVKRHIKKVYKARKSLRTQDWNRYTRVQKTKHRKELALIRVFGAILIANFITWAPFIIHAIVSLKVEPDTTPLGYYILIYFSTTVHTVLHPLIEGFFLPEIKDIFKKMFFCKKFIDKQEPESNTCNGLQLEDSTNTSDGKTSTMCCNGGCLDICSFAVLPDPTSSKTETTTT